jgi:hypothetical protein
MAGPFSTTGNTSSFLSSTMTRPSMAAMSFRTPTPTPLNFNISSFLPSFPQLQNTLLMRNIFGGTQTRVIPRQVTPPPKKK